MTGSQSVKKIAIAAGGTAGHVVPALAVADALRADGIEVVFFGGERAEAAMVPDAGYKLHRLSVSGLDRRNPLKAVHAGIRAFGAVVHARRMLAREQVQAVMAGGGYVAGPVGLAAWTLRLPLLVTEADAHLGVANRLLAPLARRVCLAFAIDGRSGGKYLLTGRPIATRTEPVSRVEARVAFGLPPDGRCLLVFGGSLGARTLNRATIDAYGGDLPPGVSILHLTGRGDYQECIKLLEKEGAPGGYVLRDYTDRFDVALAAADVALCRAGGSIFELAAAGLPSILVPYPHASANHQEKNARWLVDGDAAVIVRDSELNGGWLRDTVARLFEDAQRLYAMGEAARRLAKPDAARQIAGELLRIGGDR